MVGFGWVLYRVNAVYMRRRGPYEGDGHNHSAWLVSLGDERARFRRERAPRPLIDLAMTSSLAGYIAVVEQIGEVHGERRAALAQGFARRAGRGALT